MAIVDFDTAKFRAGYPHAAAGLTDEQLQQAFNMACLYLDNTEHSHVPYDPDKGILERETLLYMLVCHLCTLSQRGSGIVGNLTSASEGSVSASFSAPQIKNAEWYSQTQCGLAYYQATQKYRLGGRWLNGCFR